MIINTSSPEDAQAILDLQRLAYRSEALLYGDDKLPPLTETVDQVRAEFGHRLILKAVDDGLIDGSVRAHQAGDTCHVGPNRWNSRTIIALTSSALSGVPRIESWIVSRNVPCNS